MIYCSYIEWLNRFVLMNSSWLMVKSETKNIKKCVKNKWRNKIKCKGNK